MAATRYRWLSGAAAMVLSIAGPVVAQERIEIMRGADSVVYSSCVPSLKAVNNTRLVVDYLEVGLEFLLASGESRMLTFRSRYRDGIERPIEPGVTADLKVQLDLVRPLGAACTDIVAVRVNDAVCEASGKPCTGIIAIDLGRR